MQVDPTVEWCPRASCRPAGYDRGHPSQNSPVERCYWMVAMVAPLTLCYHDPVWPCPDEWGILYFLSSGPMQPSALEGLPIPLEFLWGPPMSWMLVLEAWRMTRSVVHSSSGDNRGLHQPVLL